MAKKDRAGRKAKGVDADVKAANLKRLKRIEGQVQGLSRMIEGTATAPTS